MSQILAKKIGMMQVYDNEGVVIPVTVVEAGPCYVVNMRTKEKNGYIALQIGFGLEKKANKPMEGYFKKIGAKQNFSHLREFRLNDLTGYSQGQEIKVDSFKPNELVNVTSTSIGKGFQGIIKRHHANRGPMSHGSKHHRLPGSSGSGTHVSHVYKGKRRAGRMGGDRVTVKNLLVVSVDPSRNLMLLRGAVPGPKNSFLMIKSTGHSAKMKEQADKKAKGKEKGKETK